MLCFRVGVKSTKPQRLKNFRERLRASPPAPQPMLLRAAAARLRPRAASARLCTAASDAAVHLAEVQAKNEALQAQLLHAVETVDDPLFDHVPELLPAHLVRKVVM